jgi:peptidoglycan/xylan/chitin deacetylase (PgdA/CDA1 family)
MRLTFHYTETGGVRASDLWTVDASSYISAGVPNGIVLTDASGNYSAFAGPDDIDTLWVTPHTGAARTQITATRTVANGTTVDGGTYARVAPRAIVRSTPARLLTGFQSGHGWTGSSWGSIDTASGTDTKLGLGKSVYFTSNSAGTGQFLSSPVLSAIDFTNINVIGVWLKITSGVANLNTLNLYLGQDNTYADSYNIGAYSSNPMGSALSLPTNQWTLVPFAITDAASIGSPARTGVKAIRLRMADLSAPVVGYFGGIVLNPNPTTFSTGVVSFCADDGWGGQYTQLAASLIRYGYPATLFPICDLIDSSSSYMTTAQLQELHESYGWSVGQHSYTLADHATGFASMTSLAVEANIRNALAWNLDRGLSKGAGLLAYPLSSYNDTVKGVARKVCTAAYTTAKLPREPLPLMRDRMELNRLFLDSSTVAANVTAEIDKAYAWPCHLVIATHDVVASGATGNQTNRAILDTIVDYCNTKGIAVRAIDDVFATVL